MMVPTPNDVNARMMTYLNASGYFFMSNFVSLARSETAEPTTVLPASRGLLAPRFGRRLYDRGTKIRTQIPTATDIAMAVSFS